MACVPVDFLLTARRNKAAVLRVFAKAMKASGVPEKVTMDKSAANKAAMNEINTRGETPVIALSNGSPGRCSTSSHFDRPEVSWPASNSCT